MPRARNIKPSFFRNPDLAELEPIERLLFIGLWTMADREGRLEDRPRYIKFELLPSDQFDIDVALNALQNRGFILRYEHGDGRFIQVVNFVKHQNPHVKEAPSTIPAPDKHGADTMQAGLNPDSPLLNPESGLLNDDAGEAPAEKQADEPKAKTPRKQPETFVPETFPLESRHLEYAGKKGLTKTEAERETEKFLLWHGAKQSRHVDWYKAWQGWILRASENKAKLTPFQKPDEEIPGHESWRNRKAVLA